MKDGTKMLWQSPLNRNPFVKFPFCFSSHTAFSLLSKTNGLLALTNIYIQRLKQFTCCLWGFLYTAGVSHYSLTIRQRGTFRVGKKKHLIWNSLPLATTPSRGEAEKLMGNKCVWMEALRSERLSLNLNRFMFKTKCSASLIFTCKSPPLSTSKFQWKRSLTP